MFFFFNDTATTEIYTLSLHDALPIYPFCEPTSGPVREGGGTTGAGNLSPGEANRTGGATSGVSPDRKSTRLNSSHANISYAVFCLKKKNTFTLLFVHNFANITQSVLS